MGMALPIFALWLLNPAKISRQGLSRYQFDLSAPVG
jgi:hypothetical protein